MDGLQGVHATNNEKTSKFVSTRMGASKKRTEREIERTFGSSNGGSDIKTLRHKDRYNSQSESCHHDTIILE